MNTPGLRNRQTDAVSSIVTRNGKHAVRRMAEGFGPAPRPLPELGAFRTSIAIDRSLVRALIGERENERR